MTHPPLFQVGMRYSFTYRAQPVEVPGKGWFNEKFGRDAFTGQIGKIVPLNLDGLQAGHARVISADVSEDGGSVEFTYEITDLDPGLREAAEKVTAITESGVQSMSFAFHEPDPDLMPHDPLVPKPPRIRRK